ncbi:MAG: energy-coupling factor ABC transporter ATP-binding protein [Candidatus Promineifilaceae bacterium]
MQINVEQVSFAYPSGVQALRDVSLAIAPGEGVALIGENGAGKSTLARHLNGLLRPGRGQVRIGDWDTRQASVGQLATRVGYLFQNPDRQLFANSVLEEVAFGPRQLGQSEEEIQRSVSSTLGRVGLLERSRLHPYDLQAAERKLVALAAVLAMQTPVLILDEPTMGQDSQAIGRIAAIIAELKAAGKTVLMISHDIDFCGEQCERVVVMADGRIVADGPAGEILGRHELLLRSGVEAPQLARLALALGVPGTPLTPAEFVSAWAAGRDARQ